MRDRTNKQLAEKLDIIKESFNENGSVFELLTIVQERLNSIPIEPLVMPKIAEENQIRIDENLKWMHKYLQDPLSDTSTMASEIFEAFAKAHKERIDELEKQ